MSKHNFLARTVSLSIFLVEDNPMIRDSLVSTIEDMVQAQVIGTAETEAEAVSWLLAHKSRWSVAVVDLFLREGNGLGVVKACHPHPEAQRVVVLTNYATQDARERCLAAGADKVFDKSTELDLFLAYCEAAQSRQ